MTELPRRQTSLTLDAQALDQARRQQWLTDNAEVFAAQADWHERHSHPLAAIMAGQGAETLNR